MIKKKVDMKDTALGRFEATCKRDYDAVVDKIPKEERDNLRRNLDNLGDMEE